ncbi:hypothetical protein BCR33DRAFT_719433 [Rhizoclosmatium globosum]|uniref:Uncharacterized protein n=1 Tax=Rhizoclosmatium globosum TaxID=329046 RepID=A0A1Y2C2A4_9FUNG|nr:hypothetical protein BCR33DRAFT_719433 [Rhizoclosmatium globosum]|eukprot:ORY40445.1 hypothetical protein BCR33DRAFT_719433 [Rhizoclosmatium globosum]
MESTLEGKTLQNLVEKGTVVLDGSPNVKRLEELGFLEERRIQTAFHLLYAEHECVCADCRKKLNYSREHHSGTFEFQSGWLHVELSGPYE